MKATKHCNRKPSFGSVSCATMRAQDLIPAFMAELEYYAPKTARQLLKESGMGKGVTEGEYYQSEDADYLLEALFDALDVVAGRVPFMYFGSHPGDGADYGFWLSDDFQYDAEQNGVLLWKDDTRNPSRKDLEGYDYYLIVNERGNMTLFNRAYQEVWSLC